MAKAIFCLCDDERRAEQIVDQLRTRGFSNNDISVLFPDNSGTRDFAHEQNTKAPEGAAAGAGTGGVLGWLVGIGSLAIPGAGRFMAAGPIMAALAGAGVGAAVGGTKPSSTREKLRAAHPHFGSCRGRRRPRPGRTNL